jgi:hypothetical protein
LLRYLKRFIRKVKVQPVEITDQPKYFFDTDHLFKTNNQNNTDNLFSDFLLNNKTSSINLKRIILNNIKFKKITGVRISAAGRLSRRYTASRSQYKVKYQGNLQNVYSSVKNYSYVLLRSRYQPNLDYKKLNSKSRIGSFGLKG